MKRSPQQRAQLRTCASCEWVHTGFDGCPKCGFATYGARWVYGNAAYRFKRTQEPWLNKKMQDYRFKLLDEIDQANVTSSLHTTQRVAKLIKTIELK